MTEDAVIDASKTEPLLLSSSSSSSSKGLHEDKDNDNDNNNQTMTTNADADDDVGGGGSTVYGAIFNFTNTIVGAGAIGLGGAMAQSGGVISILAILACAVLTKRSLDLVVQLSVSIPGADGSYEGLANVSLGWQGWVLVCLAKFLYSFGCLVAYLVVMIDNLGPSLLSLGKRLHPPGWNDQAWWVTEILAEPERFTWLCSLVFLLPLCLMRDMTPLANFSLLSIALMATLTFIVIYLFVADPDNAIRQPSTGFYDNWLEIRPGVVESLGTYVFAFVSQHTVHLTFQSMRPVDRTVDKFAKVTSWSIGIATSLTLVVGTTVYMSFWQKAQSDMFNCYPDVLATDLAKLLLSSTMLLTFPLPFFTCREILIIAFTKYLVKNNGDALDEPLITLERQSTNSDDEDDGESGILLPGQGNQLRLPYHILWTVGLWMLVVSLAIAVPNLKDVLDLVGCASGTLIAFVLPGLFSLQIRGYSTEGALLLGVGVFVGIIGTVFSLKSLVHDTLTSL